MVSAWCTSNDLALGQQKVQDKSNEITAIPALLDVLVLKGCLATIDAMGCQQAIAEKIIQQEADYILAVKDNQKIVRLIPKKQEKKINNKSKTVEHITIAH